MRRSRCNVRFKRSQIVLNTSSRREHVQYNIYNGKQLYNFAISCDGVYIHVYIILTISTLRRRRVNEHEIVYIYAGTFIRGTQHTHTIQTRFRRRIYKQKRNFPPLVSV